MYYNDLYKIAEFIGINRMLALVESGFGHNFFNIKRLCVLGALGGEISGLRLSEGKSRHLGGNPEPCEIPARGLRCSLNALSP